MSDMASEWWVPGRVLKPPMAREFPETIEWRAAQIAAGATVLTADEWNAIMRTMTDPPPGSDLGVIVVPVETIGRLQQLATDAGLPDAEMGTMVGALIRTADAAREMSSVVHPWGEPQMMSVLAAAECELCWASDGDARCVRCGRSTAGFDVCECGDLRRIGPCVGAR